MAAPLRPGVFPETLILPAEGFGHLTPKTAGSRPILDTGTETGPPPVAEARAQRLFEITGMVLILAILVSAALILIRGRW